MFSVFPFSKSTLPYKPILSRACDTKVDLSGFSVSAAIKSTCRYTDNYKMKCDRFQYKQGQVGARSPKGEGASASMNLLFFYEDAKVWSAEFCATEVWPWGNSTLT